MATGCCGVKKKKLNSSIISSTNGTNSTYSANGSSYARNGDHHMDHTRTLFGFGGSFSRSPGKCGDSYSNDDRLSNHLNSKFQAPADGSVRQQPRVICAEMVVFCFDVLYSYLHSTEAPKQPKFSNEQFPLFVTWKMGKDKKLRGCIGTFNSTSLHQGLREYAITSACKDSRFEPISADEFARLHCSVSLLTDFEMADHYLDWEIGIHGIRIEFCTEKGSKKAATYLPEVATEQGWSQIQTIDSLLRKGGFKGTITPEIRGSICLVRFQSEKMTVSYTEYVMHKQRPSVINRNHNYNGLSPPMTRSLALNGGVELPNHFLDGSLPSISGASPSGLYRNQLNGYRTRHGHSTSTQSIHSTFDEGMNERHRISASGNRGNYGRNHNASRHGSMDDATDSQRHPSLVNVSRYVSLSTHMPPPAL